MFLGCLQKKRVERVRFLGSDNKKILGLRAEAENLTQIHLESY